MSCLERLLVVPLLLLPPHRVYHPGGGAEFVPGPADCLASFLLLLLLQGQRQVGGAFSERENLFSSYFDLFSPHILLLHVAVFAAAAAAEPALVEV